MKTVARDLDKAKADLSKSEVGSRCAKLTENLQLALAATSAPDFERYIHLVRLHTDKISAELHWYFGDSDD
jgi:hypothetical protein